MGLHPYPISEPVLLVLESSTDVQFQFTTTVATPARLNQSPEP